MSVDPISALPSRPSPGVAGARLGALYTDHSRMVYGVCRMILRDADEAEDATQQVFLSAYRSLLTGTEVRDPAAWLGTIARNACRRRATVRLREPLAVGDPTLVSPGVDEQASDREETAALYAELAALPEKQREAVVLRDLYGLRYDEVARALGTSRPAVEALLFRARRRLKRRLRPGIAAGVLVVPLAVQESIAYAVPGFASAAAPAGAAVTAAGIPILVKLAATGAAVGIAGSAGVAVQDRFHDPPARPVSAATVPKASTPAAVPVVPAELVSTRPPLAPRALVPVGGAAEDDDEPEHDEDDDVAQAAGGTGHDEAEHTEDEIDRSDEDHAQVADEPHEADREGSDHATEAADADDEVASDGHGSSDEEEDPLDTADEQAAHGDG